MIDAKFLEEIGVTDAEAVKKITDEYTADIKAEQEKTTTVQAQLAEASEKIKSFEDMDVEKIKQEAADYKAKYEQAEADRKAKAYEDGIKAYVAKQGMKNDIYAQHLTSQITAKGLQFDENGTLLGGDDVVKALRESCPDAFLPNKSERVAAPTSGNSAPALSGVEAEFAKLNPGIKF